MTDTTSEEPIEAEVYVENHDKDSSRVYSSLPFGDYYRPIGQGTYDVTYSHPWYTSKTISNIEVKNGEAIVVDVELDWVGNSPSEKNSFDGILIQSGKSMLKIICNGEDNSTIEISIFDLSGRLTKKNKCKNRFWNTYCCMEWV